MTDGPKKRQIHNPVETAKESVDAPVKKEPKRNLTTPGEDEKEEMLGDSVVEKEPTPIAEQLVAEKPSVVKKDETPQESPMNNYKASPEVNEAHKKKQKEQIEVDKKEITVKVPSEPKPVEFELKAEREPEKQPEFLPKEDYVPAKDLKVEQLPITGPSEEFDDGSVPMSKEETVAEDEVKSDTELHKAGSVDEDMGIGGVLAGQEDLTEKDANDIKSSYNDLSNLITVITGDIDEAKDMLAAIIKRETSDGHLSEDSRDEVANLYRILTNTYEKDLQGKLLSAMLREDVIDNHLKLKKLPEKIKDGTSRRTKVKGGVARGNAARLAVMSRIRGLKRINLLNSGFYIDLRPNTLLELSEFYHSVDENSNEYGRILGGHTHIIQDVNIKSKIIELLPDIVQNSNLVDWDEGDTLIESISFLDYDTVLWGMITLMYSKGIELELKCSNPECEYLTTSVKVDLNELRLSLIDKIPDKAMEVLMSGNKITQEEALDYQKNLLNTKGYIEDDLNDVKLKYHFKVPTIKEYLEFGLSLIAKLANTIKGKFTVENIEARNSLTYSTYQMFQPWVDKIEYFDEDGELDMVVDDAIGIGDTLSLAQQDSLKLRSSILEYMVKCKLTYICYTSMKCPKCSRRPTGSVEDYLPVDPQQVFFYLTCQHLLLAELH